MARNNTLIRCIKAILCPGTFTFGAQHSLHGQKGLIVAETLTLRKKKKKKGLKAGGTQAVFKGRGQLDAGEASARRPRQQSRAANGRFHVQRSPLRAVRRLQTCAAPELTRGSSFIESSCRGALAHSLAALRFIPRLLQRWVSRRKCINSGPGISLLCAGPFYKAPLSFSLSLLLWRTILS